MPRGALALAVVAHVLSLLDPAPAWAESAPGLEERWAFAEAWAAFRRDVDSTLPGEQGEVFLVEQLGPAPAWLLRDAVRVATAPAVVVLLSRRIARDRDRGAIPALRAALERTTEERARRALERALVELGDGELLGQVARQLRAASSPARWEAARTLAAAGEAGAPALRAALEDPDGQTRLVAAAALAGRGDMGATRLLVRLLESPNPFERAEAAHGLALGGDGRGAAVLRGLLAQPGADRARAARSLGLVGTNRDLGPLREALRSLPTGRARGLRLELLEAIGRLTLRTSLSDVASVLPDDEPELEAGEPRGVGAARLEAIGMAVAGGAADRRSIAARVASSLEGPLSDETPAAFARRREAVRPLADLLSGRPSVTSPPAPGAPFDLGASRAALAGRGGDPGARQARFQAAARILRAVGERLGHGARAEPPAGRVVGLGAERAVDGNLLTSWVAGPMAGPLRLELPEPRRLDRLHLVGGCVESRASYRSHARVRRLELVLDGGATVAATLADRDPYFQTVELPGVETRRISLTVESVYPGERDGSPACIAELRLE